MSKDNRSVDRAVACEAHGAAPGMVKPSSPWFRAARREALTGGTTTIAAKVIDAAVPTELRLDGG
jgi:hypothetical protein